jgi:hypothetical protein
LENADRFRQRERVSGLKRSEVRPLPGRRAVLHLFGGSTPPNVVVTSQSCGPVSLPSDTTVQQLPSRWVAKRHQALDPPGHIGAPPGVASPARCGSGRGSRRSWALWPLPAAFQPGNIGASPAETRPARPNWHKRQCAGQVRRLDREEAMRIPTPPWLVAGPPVAAARLPAPSADSHPRRTLVAARPARRPDHDRGSDQPTERSRLRATRHGERPCSRAVRCVGHRPAAATDGYGSANRISSLEFGTSRACRTNLNCYCRLHAKRRSCPTR